MFDGFQAQLAANRAQFYYGVPAADTINADLLTFLNA